MIDIKESRLANGLKVIHAPMRSHPVASAQLYVRMGSCWEQPDEAGWSHFLEHLVFKATENWPGNTLTEAAARLGASINAFTEHDSTCFTVTLPSERLALGLDLLAELGYRSCFGEEDFRFERKVVIEEIKQYRNDPEDWFIETIPALYYERNPLRRPIAGVEETLRAAAWAQLMEFYRRWYTPANAFLVITGDAGDDEMLRLAERSFGAWNGLSPQKTVLEHEPWQTVGGFHHVQRKVDNPILAFTMPEYADAHPDAHAQSMITRIFAGGKNSRLYERLFHEEKLIDGCKISSLSGLHDGLGIVQMFPRRDADCARVLDIVRQEMERLRRFGPRAAEIERQKTEMLHGHRYAQEYTESLAFSLGSEETSGDWRAFLQFPDMAASIDRGRVERLIDANCRPDSLHLFHMGARRLHYDFSAPRAEAIPRISRCKGVDYCEASLPNGMRVSMKRTADHPTIGMALTTGVSQLNETEDRGVNHLAGTLLLYGTKRRNHHQLMADCSRHGMAVSVASRMECTTMRCKCFELEPAIEMLSEMLYTPTFPEEHLQNIKKTAASMLDRVKDQPGQHAARLWKQMLFGRGSQYLGRLGGKTDLKSLSRARVQRWFKRWYRPWNQVLSIVGDIDFDRTMGLLESAFHRMDEREELPAPAPVIDSSKKLRHTRRSGSDQSIIHVGGFAASGMEAEHTTALYVLSHILGGDLHSRLYATLREQMGAAYSVGFDYHATRKLGWFAASAIVDADTERACLDEIVRQMEACSNGDITARELETAQIAIRGERLLDEESVLHQAQVIGALVSLGYGYDYYLKRDERLRAVTLDMLQDAARRWFTPDNLYTYVYQ